MNELPFHIEGYNYTKEIPYPFNIEIWKPLVFENVLPNAYKISSTGRVFSLFYNKILGGGVMRDG